MKIEYIKSFSTELEKTSGWPMRILTGGLTAMTINDVAKTTRQAGANLGTKYMPSRLKPASNFTFESGQYIGRHI